MLEEIKRVGETLKAKRRELNLSLKEVENATSIRTSYLEAIEDGTIKDQIAGIYVHGFLKQYATFLGLEVDRLMRENPTAFHLTVGKHEFAYGIGTLEVRGSQSSGFKWIPNLFWGFVSALVLIIAWYLSKYLGLL